MPSYFLTVEKIGIGDAEEDEYRINIMEESQLEEEQMEKAREKMKAFCCNCWRKWTVQEQRKRRARIKRKKTTLEDHGKKGRRLQLKLMEKVKVLGAAENMGSDGKDKEGKAEAQKGPAASVWEKLQSPDSCQIKGIKIFKVAEIEESVGKEKECRIFLEQEGEGKCTKQ